MRGIVFSAMAAALLLGSAFDAMAHGIWIAQRHGDLAIVYGHGASDEAYDPGKVAQVIGHLEDGTTAPAATEDHGNHVLVTPPENAAVLTATMDNGYWSEGPDGKWVNKPKSEVDGAKQGGRYLKHTVAILDHSPLAAKAKGMTLEIVPDRDPSELSAGDELGVTVLLGGKPLADTLVVQEYTTDSENKSVRTDAKGRASVTIRNNGLNVIAVSADEPSQEPEKADRVGHFATLSFSVDRHAH